MCGNARDEGKKLKKVVSFNKTRLGFQVLISNAHIYMLRHRNKTGRENPAKVPRGIPRVFCFACKLCHNIPGEGGVVKNLFTDSVNHVFAGI